MRDKIFLEQLKILIKIFKQMGNYLDTPVIDFNTSSIVIGSNFFVGTSIQGFRKTMEDRILMTPLEYEETYLLAVFDGHGGEYVAEYLMKNISYYIL